MIRKLIKEAYLNYIPRILRKHLLFHGEDKYIKLRDQILNFYKHLNDIDNETKEVISYLRKHPAVSVFPYDFLNSYRKQKIEIFEDNQVGFKYVIHNGKRMYYKKHWDINRIQSAYRSLCIEQDVRSPHCYLTNSFNVSTGDIVCDLGAAEGIFALNVIDSAKHIHLFEPDVEWIEALKLTFAPWQNKVTIHHKFVTKNDDDNSVSLDGLFAEGTIINLVKADIEGEEIRMLQGAKNSLHLKNIKKLVLCTYHKDQDYKNLESILNNYGYSTKPSNGYMIFIYDKNIQPPYLRRGVIRATYKEA